MVVSVGFDPRQQSWQVQWRCHGKHSLRVRNNALNGDGYASERVARRLQQRIVEAVDPSDRDSFVAVLDELITEELANLGTAASQLKVSAAEAATETPAERARKKQRGVEVVPDDSGVSQPAGARNSRRDSSSATGGGSKDQRRGISKDEARPMPKAMIRACDEGGDTGPSDDDDDHAEPDSHLCIPRTRRRLDRWWDETTELPVVVDKGEVASITRSPICRYEVFLPHTAPDVPYTTTLSDMSPALGDFFALATEVGDRRRKARVGACAEVALARASPVSPEAASVECPAPQALSPNERAVLQTRIDALCDDDLSQVATLVVRFLVCDEEDALRVDLDVVPADLQWKLYALVERLSAACVPARRGAVRWRWGSGVPAHSLVAQDQAAGPERLRSRTPPKQRASNATGDLPSVYFKVIWPLWADAVACGQKFFECSKQSGTFKRMRGGDMLLVCASVDRRLCDGSARLEALCGKVAAVAEVSSDGVRAGSDRRSLKSMLPRPAHQQLDRYLGSTKKFGYVKFSRVFDCRELAMSRAELLAHVGLDDPTQVAATGKRPQFPVGLLHLRAKDDGVFSRLQAFLAVRPVYEPA